MGKTIYIDHRCDAIAYTYVELLMRELSMPQSYYVDAGRLEDAVAGTVKLVADRGHDVTHVSVALDTSNPCCHGLSGIFGQRGVQALRGRLVWLDAVCKVDGDRIDIVSWSICQRPS